MRFPFLSTIYIRPAAADTELLSGRVRVLVIISGEVGSNILKRDSHRTLPEGKAFQLSLIKLRTLLHNPEKMLHVAHHHHVYQIPSFCR